MGLKQRLTNDGLQVVTVRSDEGEVVAIDGHLDGAVHELGVDETESVTVSLKTKTFIKIHTK